MPTNIQSEWFGGPKADLGDEIAQSLRFITANKTCLTKTLSQAGNDQTWTFSTWLKKSPHGTNYRIFTGGTPSGGSQFTSFMLQSDNTIRFYSYNGSSVIHDYRSTAQFNDVSAWYHFVVAYDTTNATAADRIKIYVNGTQITEWQSGYQNAPTQNFNSYINRNSQELNVGTYIGGTSNANTDNFIEGYLAETVFIDGSQLAPTEFGRTNGDGVWVNKTYDGSYSGNSFRFKYNSSDGLGYDCSGLGNNFTANNFNEYSSAVNVYFPVTGDAATVALGTTLRGTTPNGNGGTPITVNSTNHMDVDFGRSATSHTLTITNSGSGVTIYVSPDGTANSWVASNVTNGSFTSGQTITAGDSSAFRYLRFTCGNYNVSNVTAPVGGFTGDVDYKDTPTSNYPTMNSLFPHTSPQYSGNWEDGNLSAGGHTTAWASAGSTMYLPKTGKWYAEFELTNTSSYQNWYIGVMSYDTDFGNYSTGYALVLDHGNNVSETGTILAQGSGTFTQGDVVGIAVNMDTKTVEWFKNGVSHVSATAASSTWDSYLNDEPGGGGLFIQSRLYYYSGQRLNINYGQRSFIYTPPAGYKALQSNELPEPEIKNGKEHFDAVSFTGTAGAKTITGLQFQPDLVWIKSSSHTTQSVVFDSVRGASAGYHSPYDTGNQETVHGSMTSFNSDGFTVGAAAGGELVNGGSRQYSAWCWKCDESFTPAVTGGLTNVSGKRNTKAGLSIVKFDGSLQNATIEHGLNSKPHFVWVKRVSGSTGPGDHVCWHISIGANNEYHMNNSGSATAFGASGTWNYTAPSDSVLSLGNYNTINASGNTMVAYIFAPVAGYSKFGRYRGNSSDNGPFVYTGFKPRFIILKKTIGANGSWIMYDTVRDSSNPNTNSLTGADSNAAEVLSGNNIDILSNGFKVRDPGSICNGSSQSVEISYLAFAEHPFGGENTPPVPAF